MVHRARCACGRLRVVRKLTGSVSPTVGLLCLTLGGIVDLRTGVGDDVASAHQRLWDNE